MFRGTDASLCVRCWIRGETSILHPLLDSDKSNKLCLPVQLFPRASQQRARREGTMPPMPPTERAAMARRVAASVVSSVLSDVRRGQRARVALLSAATIPARTSGGRLAHAATRRARSASVGTWPPPAFGRDVGGTAPRLAPGADRAAPGAARSSESAYSPGDSAGAWGFNSPRLHSSVTQGLAETSRKSRKSAEFRASARSAPFPCFRSFPAPSDAFRCAWRCAQAARVRVMIAILRWLWFFVLWVAASVAVSALSNWILGQPRRLWEAAVQGVVMGVLMILFLEGHRRGWIKGVLWNPDSRRNLEQRRKDLADERARIVEESKTRHDA